MCAHEHFKLCAHLLSSFEYLINLSISVVLPAYALCIIMSPRFLLQPYEEELGWSEAELVFFSWVGM